MNFLVDMPLSPGLVVWLADRGHNAIHAGSVGLASAADVAIMARARAEDRIVVTADLDFPRLLALAHAKGPAVILFRGGNYSEAEMRDLLDRTLDGISQGDLVCSVTVVDKARIRRTRLPLGLSVESSGEDEPQG